MTGLVAHAVLARGITDAVLGVQYCRHAVEAFRGYTRDRLHSLQNLERSRLLAAAARSSEKVRDAAAVLYAPAPALIESLLPLLALWRGLRGCDQAGTRADTERLIGEYCEESARGVRALLEARRPASERSLHSEVEALCARWLPRAHRIEERLARELEAAIAASAPWPTGDPTNVYEAEEDARVAEFALAEYEGQARTLRQRLGAHPELDVVARQLAEARDQLGTLKARIQEAKR